MRLLVGVTCVAVIAFIGYFFWEAKQAERQQFAAACEAMARNGAPDETPSDKRLASKRLQDCVNFIETGQLPK